MRNQSGIVRRCHRETGACYPALLRWSIGVAQPAFTMGAANDLWRWPAAMYSMSHTVLLYYRKGDMRTAKMEGARPSAPRTILRILSFARDLSQARHQGRPNCLPQRT